MMKSIEHVTSVDVCADLKVSGFQVGFEQQKPKIGCFICHHMTNDMDLIK
jgi:hypothetical protein